jgi:succinate dehydrogenase / fumarate reductase, membrane anchor subunit
MAKSKTVVGAHYGLRDWIGQRATAILLALFSVWLIARVFMIDGAVTYGRWYDIFVPTYAKVLTLLAILALMYHVWVGVRDIYMDYIQPTAIRLFLQVITITLLVSYALWSIMILWRV